MATTSFPTALDELNSPNPQPTDLLNDPEVPHAEQHQVLNDAMEQVQYKLGITNSEDVSSLDYLVRHLITVRTAQSLAAGNVTITADNTFKGTLRHIVGTGGSTSNYVEVVVTGTWVNGSFFWVVNGSVDRDVLITTPDVSYVLPAGEIARVRKMDNGVWFIDTFLGLNSLLNTVHSFTKNQSVVSSALTSSTSITTDASKSNYFTLTLTHNTTLTNPINLTDGMMLTWRIKQGAGAPWTMAFGSIFKWPGGTVPTLSTSVDQVDIFTGVYNAADNRLECNMLKAFA